MEAAEIADPGFWSGRESRILSPRPGQAEAELEKFVEAEGSIVFPTSGSGGERKWVSLRREALLASAEAVNRHLEAGPADVWILALPPYHVGGFAVAARAYVAGCEFKHFAGRWCARRFVEELADGGATLTSLVPSQVFDLVAAGLRPPESLRVVVVGGARLDDRRGQEARELGWPVLQSYGMTEAASQVATASLSDLDCGFRAAPLPVLPIWEHRIGEDGCLQLRGEALFEAYLRMADGEVREERPFDREGWFATSDRVEISPEGLTVLGRADRQVKILGELVDVEALEDALRAHLAGEAEVHVLTLADERKGWRLVPVMEDGEAGAEEAVEGLNGRLPGFARLDPPRFVRELPRTALGKIEVARLREEIAGQER